MSNARPYKTALVRDLLKQHKSPAAVSAALPAAFSDARARRDQAEAELTELAHLGHRADAELRRDAKDTDKSNETIRAHLTARRKPGQQPK